MENRIIKFRGIRKNWNPEYSQDQFRYGNLLNTTSIGDVGYGLESYEFAEVIPETVGQYTGLNDKNGVEIYEGDVIEHEGGHVCTIHFNKGSFQMTYIKGSETGITRRISHSAQYCKIIGNIYQNPELL